MFVWRGIYPKFLGRRVGWNCSNNCDRTRSKGRGLIGNNIVILLAWIDQGLDDGLGGNTVCSGLCSMDGKREDRNVMNYLGIVSVAENVWGPRSRLKSINNNNILVGFPSPWNNRSAAYFFSLYNQMRGRLEQYLNPRNDVKGRQPNLPSYTSSHC